MGAMDSFGDNVRHSESFPHSAFAYPTPHQSYTSDLSAFPLLKVNVYAPPTCSVQTPHVTCVTLDCGSESVIMAIQTMLPKGEESRLPQLMTKDSRPPPARQVFPLFILLENALTQPQIGGVVRSCHTSSSANQQVRPVPVLSSMYRKILASGISLQVI